MAKTPPKRGPSQSAAATDSHLTDEEQLIVSLRRITRAVDIHSHLLQREFGITGPQLATLRVIRRLQPVAAGALAAATHMGFATMSGILDRLVIHGYITRNRDPQDRRSVILEMTGSGADLLESAPSLLQNRLSAGIRAMSAVRRKALLDAFRTVADLMQAETTENSEPQPQ